MWWVAKDLFCTTKQKNKNKHLFLLHFPSPRSQKCRRGDERKTVIFIVIFVTFTPFTLFVVRFLEGDHLCVFVGFVFFASYNISKAHKPKKKDSKEKKEEKDKKQTYTPPLDMLPSNI